MSAPAQDSSPAEGSEPRNVVVLVHGAWHDGWCCNAVGARLTAAGIDWVAPDLPLDDYRGDAEVVREAIARFPGRSITLVGHSRAGRVISFASFESPSVDRMIYIAADVPKAGDLGMHLDKPLKAAFDGRIPVGGGYTEFDPTLALDVFYNGCPPELAQEAVGHLRPTQTDPVEDLAGFGVGWPDRSTTYLVAARDHAIHPDDERRQGSLLDEIIEVDGCHCLMLSNPDELAEIIIART